MNKCHGHNRAIMTNQYAGLDIHRAIAFSSQGICQCSMHFCILNMYTLSLVLGMISVLENIKHLTASRGYRDQIIWLAPSLNKSYVYP